MNRSTRLIAGVGGLLALLLVALAAALVLFFPAERVGALAAERASVSLDRDVSVERIRMRLFPALAVALEGVSVGAERVASASVGAASDAPLASIARVEIRPRLMPLFRRELRVRSIVIDEPALSIEVDSIPTSDPEPRDDDAPGFWSDATFEIDRIAIRGGSVRYRDLATGGSILVEGIDQEMRLDGQVRDGELTSLAVAGDVSASRIDADLPAHLAAPLRNLRLRVNHEVSLDLASRNASIERLGIVLQETALEGSGSVRSWSDPATREVSLRLSTTDAELAPLLASLPAAVRTWPAGAEAGEEWSPAAGSARIEATIEGRLGEGALPAVDGLLTLSGVSLARGRDPVVQDLSGQVTFSLDSVSTTGITGRLFDAPLRLAFSVQDPADPAIAATLAARVDLGRAANLGLLPPGWIANGATEIDLGVSGRLSLPQTIAVEGTVGVTGLSMNAPEWPAPVEVTGGALEFGGTELIGRGFAATIGNSDVAFEFALSDWIPFALGEDQPEPRLVFDGVSRRLDLDELLPVDPAAPTYGQLFFARLANAQVNGMTAEEAAESIGLRRPELPPLSAEGRYRADRVTQRGLEFQDVDLAVAARDGQLDIRGADLRLFGGAVHVAARLGSAVDSIAPSGGAPFALDFRVDSLGAQQFIQRFTLFRDHLEGALDLDGSLSLALDEHLLPLPTTVTGGGSLALLGGQLVNWSMARALGQQLGLAAFDTVSFREWTGRFEMVGSRIFLAETTIEANDIDASIAGSFDISGQLDLAGTVYLSPPLAARSSTASRLVSAASGDDGRVPVGVRISGSTQSASVSLDLSEAGRRLAEQARQEAQARASELAVDAVERVTGIEQLPRVESPAAALDSARQRVGEAVTGRLRGLFAPRAAETPAQADSAAVPADSTVFQPADTAPADTATR